MASSVRRSHFRSFGFPRSFLPGFPCILSRFWYLASLYVSFHPSSLRSHSCSTSACLLFRFLASPSFPAFSVPLLLSFRLLGLLFLPFRSSRLRLTVASPVRRFCSRFFGFPPSLRPDFSCLPSGFPYSVLCWFPFVLPCFAPAAVPQVIPFWISPPGPVPDFRFLSVPSVLASHYSASVSSVPSSS